MTIKQIEKINKMKVDLHYSNRDALNRSVEQIKLITILRISQLVSLVKFESP